MKINNKSGLKFVLLAVMMLTMVFYGCADDGGGSGLTGMDAEAAGFASTGGITLPASIENADTIPADDIDMRTSTGDITTNEEWFTDQDSVNTSITLPDSVAKSMAKAFDMSLISNYSVSGYYINEHGYSNIAFSHPEYETLRPIFEGSIPSTNDTGYVCFVVSDTNFNVLYRSHFRKITRVDGVTGLYPNPGDGSFIDVVWTNPANGSPFGGTNQVWWGTNGVADILAGSVTNEVFSIDILFDPYSVPFIVRVVSLDENGKAYAASASGLPQ